MTYLFILSWENLFSLELEIFKGSSCDSYSTELQVSLYSLHNSFFFNSGQDILNILQWQHWHNKNLNKCISCKGPQCCLLSEETLDEVLQCHYYGRMQQQTDNYLSRQIYNWIHILILLEVTLNIFRLDANLKSDLETKPYRDKHDVRYVFLSNIKDL